MNRVDPGERISLRRIAPNDALKVIRKRLSGEESSFSGLHDLFQVRPLQRLGASHRYRPHGDGLLLGEGQACRSTDGKTQKEKTKKARRANCHAGFSFAQSGKHSQRTLPNKSVVGYRSR